MSTLVQLARMQVHDLRRQAAACMHRRDRTEVARYGKVRVYRYRDDVKRVRVR